MSTIRALARSTPAGSVSTAVAATASCPSRKTVAETLKVSPTTAFTGRVPSATTGERSSIA